VVNPAFSDFGCGFAALGILGVLSVNERGCRGVIQYARQYVHLAEFFEESGKHSLIFMRERRFIVKEILAAVTTLELEQLPGPVNETSSDDQFAGKG
jgi:hypothetical protein